MSWLDKHRDRLEAYGNTISKEQENNTVNFVNSTFEDYPSFERVLINEETYDVRVLTTKEYQTTSEYNINKLMFRPYTLINRGEYVRRDNDEIWLIAFYQNDKIFPNAHVRLCNNSLKFENGREHLCVIDNKLRNLQEVDQNKYQVLPSGTLAVTVQANEDTLQIEELQRFVINGKAWEVQVIDDVTNTINGIGVVQFIIKKVPRKESEIPVEEEEEEIPNEDYYIEIVGVNELEIGKISNFTANVYLNGMLITQEVLWGVDIGTINEFGQFTAPNLKGESIIYVEFEYINAEDEVETIRSEKRITVFDNNDWGGW